MEEPILRRTWAEIDLDALAHNYQQARRKIGPNVKYLGVVKADAYGHGAIQVSRKLEQLGADYLAVSSLDEAKELRRAGIQAPILILGHTPPAMVPQLMSALRNGWLLEESEEDWQETSCFRLTVDQTGEQNGKILSTLWLRQEDGAPLRGEIAVDGEIILTADFTSFSFYDTIENQE